MGCENLKVYFPIKKGLLKRTAVMSKAVDGDFRFGSGRIDAGRGRRIGIGKNDAGIRPAAPD